MHQRGHFAARAFPVFNREGIKRQNRNAKLGRTLHHLSHGVDTGTMPSDARQAPLSGPAAIAVHDDRDVGRQSGSVDLMKKLAASVRHDSILSRNN